MAIAVDIRGAKFKSIETLSIQPNSAMSDKQGAARFEFQWIEDTIGRPCLELISEDFRERGTSQTSNSKG